MIVLPLSYKAILITRVPRRLYGRHLDGKYYDKIEQTCSINDHALARLAATYTFGFGKKV